MKLLQIQFTKFYHCLVGQVWNQEGTFRTSEHVKASNAYFQLCDNHIVLPIASQKIYPDFIFHETDEKVDKYLEKIIKWISEEQFGEGLGDPKVGELCEAYVGTRWTKRRLLAILPNRYRERFIVESVTGEHWTECPKIRSLRTCVEPIIRGDLYSWKTE